MSEKTRKSSWLKERQGKIKSQQVADGNLPKIPHRRYLGVVLPAILVLFIWSYWATVKEIWVIWMRSDEYSSGLLVPFIALYIAWSRREQIAQSPIEPTLWGLAVFVLAQLMRFFGLFFYFDSAERLSLVFSFAALVLLLFGRRLFIKVTPIMIFLLLMLPIPRRMETALTLPLQSWATTSAVFCLEVLSFDVMREGNIIRIGSTSVAVAEACNGLRMVMAFFVITGLVVLLVKRTWWEKVILLLSALPIGLLCNTIRLALTAMAFTALTGATWEKIFHDFGGYAMMPLALGLVVLELWILQKLTVAPEDRAESDKEGILISRSGV